MINVQSSNETQSWWGEMISLRFNLPSWIVSESDLDLRKKSFKRWPTEKKKLHTHIYSAVSMLSIVIKIDFQFASIYIYIYIYIVINRQYSSVWLDTQDTRSRDRNPSNFTLDKVSDHSANKRITLTKGIFKVFM